MFFNTDKTIKEANDLVLKYRLRKDASDKLGQPVLMKPEEIEKLKLASRIAGGAVHPDTNQIIPFYQRLSGFVVFNAPLVFAVMFAKQTPAFNAFMQWAN